MRSLNFALVGVKNITSQVPASKFSEEDIDAIASTILSTGELLQPIVLNMTGLNKYAVVAGDMAFYAAKKAKERDPTKAEFVNAFILEEEQNSEVIKQIGLLTPITTSPPQPATPSPTTTTAPSTPVDTTYIQHEIEKAQFKVENYLLSKLNDTLAATNNDIRKLQQDVRILQQTQGAGETLTALEALNSLDFKSIALAFKKNKNKVPSNIAEPLAQKIIEVRQDEGGHFSDYSDFITAMQRKEHKLQGIGPKRLYAVFDVLEGSPAST